MKEYICNRTIDHDGKEHSKTIKLDKGQAEPLLSCGAISDPDDMPEPEPEQLDQVSALSEALDNAKADITSLEEENKQLSEALDNAKADLEKLKKKK